MSVTSAEPKEEENEIIEEKAEKQLEEKSVEALEKEPNCPYHLGYLSERSSKEKIPDECMMCKEIVQCMLKKMRQ